MRQTILLFLFLVLPPILEAAPASINYKVTSLMWEQEFGGAMPTTDDMLEKIHSAFRIWESASQGALSFNYAGLSRESYDSRAQLPYDGTIYIVLNTRYNFHGELANADFEGEIPSAYKRGTVFVNLHKKHATQFLLTHEIGHTLGLAHSASNASVMFSQKWGGDSDTVYQLAETDTTTLRALWSPDSPVLYSISGTTRNQHAPTMAFVFAVNARNGRTFSTRADNQGRFKIDVSAAGMYYLVAKSVEASMDVYDRNLKIPHSASWYARDGISVAHHARAKQFELSPITPRVEGLSIMMLDKSAPFSLASARIQGPPGQTGFLRPGAMARIQLFQVLGLKEFQSFGTDPDYHFELMGDPEKYVSGALIRIDENAEGGERLVIVRNVSGRHIGLIGIHITE